ncbi:L-histidine N(alpha)-methyltransferase [Polyangium spumosum]|uniref:L-histidine N(Alpha)-methyltransferase n=1 Tax=Polyangium spumosum TaxID=889282 RepID=A0A6N7Q026_9BACT|nr:L-histidine N(alpha)-methyltransferase [Polyangium spumosum]MRG97157.1 L-histidine N(alpha)-methyltransferase [Polyangium spumosum]
MDGSPVRNDAPGDLAPRSSTRPVDEGAALRESLLQELPEIPARYLYDDKGSELFERITELSVYYQTRTEIAILENAAVDIVARARPRHLVELGSGAGRKIRLLLDALRTHGQGATCTMLDINELFLLQSIDRLSVDYPTFAFRGIVGDFLTDLGRLGPAGERLLVFFAGTVGNLHPDERRSFLGELAQRMADSDALLLGVDLVKDPARLEAAYDDPEGVTAAFNLNVLSVLNRRFGGDFDPSGFRHRAFYDRENAWIEMRLVARRRQDVRLAALDLGLDLDAGAEIRTEISCKFTRASLEACAAEAGLSIDRWYTDPEDLFALALLRRRRS